MGDEMIAQPQPRRRSSSRRTPSSQDGVYLPPTGTRDSMSPGRRGKRRRSRTRTKASSSMGRRSHVRRRSTSRRRRGRKAGTRRVGKAAASKRRSTVRRRRRRSKSAGRY